MSDVEGSRAGGKTEAAWAALRDALDGREPVFVEEPHLARGTLFWLGELLPHVFVAPDVYRALQSLPEGRERLWELRK